MNTESITGGVIRLSVLRGFLITVAVCLAASALLVGSGFANDIVRSTGCSFSYGLSMFGCIWLTETLLARWPLWARLAIGGLMGLVLGTAGCAWVATGDPLAVFAVGANNLRQMFMMGLLFGSVAILIIAVMERQARMRLALREIELERAERERQLAESHLRVLQSQIEPHFLFNTLANVQALIEIDPPAARHMLEQLTHLLRTSLKRSREEHVQLAEELELLRAYLEIQQIRLGARLSYRIDCAEGVDTQQHFPPLLLQPLVENAVRHGIEPAREGGEVRVDIRHDGAQLCIEVRDSGVGLGRAGSSGGHGVGLSNVRARLASLYGAAATLAVHDNPPHGTCARLALPTPEAGDDH